MHEKTDFDPDTRGAATPQDAPVHVDKVYAGGRLWSYVEWNN